MLDDLNDLDKTLYVDTEKCGVNLKQEIVYDDQTEVKKNAARMSHDEAVEHKTILRGSEENKVVKCYLKPEMVNEIEKVRDLKQHRIAEIEDEVGKEAEVRVSEEYQWERNFHISYGYEKKHEKEDWVENYNTFTQEQIPSPKSDVYQLENELDKEIE